MKERAYQLGVLQALKDVGLLKEAQGLGMTNPSINTMKDNIYRQQARNKPLDPMQGPAQASKPLPITSGTKPEAAISSAAKLAPQQAGAGSATQAPMQKIQPSFGGAFRQGGSIERRRRALRNIGI